MRCAVSGASQHSHRVNMAEFFRITFTDQELTLDGNQYDKCVFRDCVIHFGATAPMDWGDCDLDNCRIQLEGPALATMKFFYQLYHGGGASMRKYVEEMIEQIRTPPPDASAEA